MTYEKGQSGNPAGRPPGSRNKSTILAEAMFQGEAETIIRMAIDKAKAGNRAVSRARNMGVVPSAARARVWAMELMVAGAMATQIPAAETLARSITILIRETTRRAVAQRSSPTIRRFRLSALMTTACAT